MALGKQIKSLTELNQARIERRAVIVPDSWAWRKPRPAAIVLHQQGVAILRLFEMGMYLFKKNLHESKGKGKTK